MYEGDRESRSLAALGELLRRATQAETPTRRYRVWTAGDTERLNIRGIARKQFLGSIPYDVYHFRNPPCVS
jgi:hypothetical protein